MIGVFDSGFGGLHVLRSIVAALPQYSYLYLGDSARAPYGPRSQDEVYRFTKQGVDFLFDRGARLVILACNTASSEALRKIQIEYGTEQKVLGVLIPFAEAAARRSSSKRIGVIATEGTVRSGAYTREILKIEPHAVVFEQACPALVPLVEAGKQSTTEAGEAVRRCLAPVLTHAIDTLVLGCTHYGVLYAAVAAAAGTGIQLISDETVVPPRIAAYLEQHPEIEQRLARGSKPRFFSTGDVRHFEEVGGALFGSPIQAERAYLGE